MALVKIADFDPNYHENFNENDIKGMDIYTDSDEKIGTVSDVLVDEEGLFRYFVVDLGLWIFGKKVLLPVGRSRLDQNSSRIYAVGMTKEQAENLPEFNERQEVDRDYEERVRQVYRPTFLDATSSTASTYNPDTYNYQQEPSLYDLNDQDHQTFKLYQERLIASKTRTKTGEVAIGKRVETETARVSVPIEKERVVIERVTPVDAGKAVAPGSVNFGEGEVARIEVYEETADIHKEAFVHEEVRIKKVVEQEMVEAQETLRREELDVETDGLPVVEGSDSNLI
ncbi:DUF2382 domain-containing protein [Komarekiella sp. 'clone 1']|uniref:DUF2382 domain-containing protein n=1 Tax=Komarekiella delphini-convector SJRDD-AB1 TaxID=2593771 RepID=A0AA40T085_9NOST|nr:DUF2382 domain-containing protein [Komarekiella delphini-convector]MBD6618253.1 DUF2382 domain-containing protein [Komarekiella delphini-convector SJRDD-AB1]